MLHEWLSRLETRQTNFHRREAIEWSSHLICELASLSNPISRAIYFWVDSILQGYITEFVVEMITSYSEDEIKFSKDPVGGTCYL